MEQRAEGFDVWQDPFVTLRLPKIFDLRADPFERAEHEAGDGASIEPICSCRRRSLSANT
jgi:hypothetical protein